MVASSQSGASLSPPPPPRFLLFHCRPAPTGGERPAASVAAGGEAAWHEASEYVNAPWGLFPAPLSASQRLGAPAKAVVDHFRLLGRTLAKALQDCRLMDLPLSYVFYRCGACILGGGGGGGHAVRGRRVPEGRRGVCL